MLDIFSVAVVFIRAGALLIIASALTSIPGILTVIKQADREPLYSSYAPDPNVGPMVIWWLSLVLLAAVFMIFARKLARFLTRGLETTNVQIDEASLSTLQRMAFAILGAYLIVYAVPALVRMAAVGFLNATRESSDALYSGASSLYIIEAAIRLALGLWLLLGSRQITASIGKMWMKVRSSLGAE